MKINVCQLLKLWCYKMLLSVEISSPYVIIRAQRYLARKDNNSMAHFKLIINNYEIINNTMSS